MRSHSTHARDSSLRRLSVVNRWLIAASVTLTGVLTDVAAHAFPGKRSSRLHGNERSTSKHSHEAHRPRTPSHKPAAGHR